MRATSGEPGSVVGRSGAGAAFGIVGAISFCHCLNDLIQSLLPAIYPILKSAYSLDFAQIGLITLAFQITASLLQPLVGIYTDKHPRPYSLPLGMLLSLSGLTLLAFAGSYEAILCAAVLIGMGSSVFHPEASRVVRMASGGRHGTAQSIFQVGGSFGSALGPVLAAFIVVPRGQGSVGWFSIGAVIGMAVLAHVGRWYGARLVAAAGAGRATKAAPPVSPRKVGIAIAVLVLLIFSKSFYTAAFTSYHTFYLIERFGASVQYAQLSLFVFLAALALGTLLGGPVSDRFGSKIVIWASILGVLPFTLLLPHAGLTGTVILTVPIGLILGASTPQIVVFGQDLMPGRIGLVSGLFMGVSFGMGGLGAAFLGEVADRTSIEFVYRVCAWLPAIGLVAAFLPSFRGSTRTA